jgi:hypothetical protein
MLHILHGDCVCGDDISCETFPLLGFEDRASQSKAPQEIQIFKALPKPDQTHQQFFEHHKFDAGGLISQL